MNLFGKYFDDNEKVLKSLTKIYGIGRKTAEELGITFGIGTTKKVKELTKETWSKLIQAIELGPNKYNTLIKVNHFDTTYKNLSLIKIKTEKNVAGKLFIQNKSLTQQLCENRAITIIRDNIELAKKIKSYKGIRHLEGLPCRGQRTHTNAITARKKK